MQRLAKEIKQLSKGISEDWKNRGIGDAKMHRGIEEWRFNDSSLNEIPQKQLTDTQYCHSEGDSPKESSFSDIKTAGLFRLTAHNDSLSENSQEQLSDNDLFASLESPIRLFTDKVLSPYSPIALSPSNRKCAFTLAEGATHVETWKDKSRIAFTLAEVLITLAIIGVVAAITIPSIIQKYQQHVVITQLKKVYTVLNQAVKLSVIDNGDTDNWNTDLDLNTYIETYFKPYLKITKICANAIDCGYLDGYTFTDVAGNETTYSNSKRKGFITIDGYVLMINRDNKKGFYIDLNGSKNPNKLGRDYFEFDISNNQVIGAGSNMANSYCS